jgi:hypothetical protein
MMNGRWAENGFWWISMLDVGIEHFDSGSGVMRRIGAAGG